MPRVLPQNAVTIPAGATRVFEGVLFDVYQWPQTLFDGTEATFEMLRRPDTVQVIILQANSLVLLRETQPGRASVLKFPGGRVDKGEEWLEAAQREVLEETGLKLAHWRLVDVRQPVGKLEWFVATYVASEVTASSPPTYDSGEKIILELLTLPAAQAALAEAPNPFNGFAGHIVQRAASIEALGLLPLFEG